MFVVFYEEPTLRNKFGADYDRLLPQRRPLVAAGARLEPVFPGGSDLSEELREILIKLRRGPSVAKAALITGRLRTA